MTRTLRRRRLAIASEAQESDGKKVLDLVLPKARGVRYVPKKVGPDYAPD
jgi:hypothetical protein